MGKLARVTSFSQRLNMSVSSKWLNVWKLGLRCDLIVKRLIEKLQYLFHEGHMILCSLVCQFMRLFFMQVWGTIIMQKKYRGPDYFLAFLVTVGCSIFILYPVWSDSLLNSLNFPLRCAHTRDCFEKWS